MKYFLLGLASRHRGAGGYARQDTYGVSSIISARPSAKRQTFLIYIAYLPYFVRFAKLTKKFVCVCACKLLVSCAGKILM